MSGSGKITLEWGDGRYTFGLQIGDVIELWENPLIKAGPVTLYKRLQSGAWGPWDAPEVLRLALIRGSKVSPVQAMKLIDRYYHQASKVDGIEIAMKIIEAYLLWPADDPVGKTQAAGEMNGQPTSPMNES